MAFTINPKDDENNTGGGTSRPILTAGKRTMWVCGVDFGTSRAGNKKIDVRMVCVDDMEKDGAEVGAYCWDTFTLTQAAAWRLGQAARALGQRDQFDAENEELMDEILRRSPVVVSLEGEEYNGKTKVRPQHYAAHQGEIPETWEDAVEKGEKWHEDGKRKRASGGSGGGGGLAPVAPSDDEIPF